MGGDEYADEVWQPRFYAVCALSTSIICLVLLFTGSDTWWSGFAFGFGLSGTIALLFLSVQHYSLTRGVHDGI